MKTSLIAGLLLLCVAHSADAVIVYTSPGFAGAIGCNNSCSGAVSDFGGIIGSNQVAERFVLGSGMTLDGVSWVGSRSGALDFTVNFYNARTDELPAHTPLASFQIGNHFTQFPIGGSGDLMSADFAAPLSLFAGVPYYLSIVANTVGSSSSWGWYNAGFGRRVQLQAGYSDWRIVNENFAQSSFGFLLHGSLSVPEPSTLTLLGLALIILTVVGKRTRGLRACARACVRRGVRPD